MFSLHSCAASLPSLLIMEPCYVMETAKETSVCQALTQQGSSDQGVIPVLQEYKLRPREGKQKAPVSRSFRTQKCLQSPPASPSSPPAGPLQPRQFSACPWGRALYLRFRWDTFRGCHPDRRYSLARRQEGPAFDNRLLPNVRV